jgi:gliding motility-associated transport system ATP-binding protein
MISVERLTKKYAGRTAVDDVSFEVGDGEVVGFLGPNGAGKSTIMRVITSYLAATSGRVTVAGHDVFADSIRARREIGYMPESVPLYEDFRVKEYLTFRARLKGLRGRDVRRRVGEVMDLCGVTEVRKKMISSLSKGYRQRVGLADALVHRPKLLILDEPTNGLDVPSARTFKAALSRMRELGVCIVFSSHLIHDVSALCDTVVIISRGRTVAQGEPDALCRKTRCSTLEEAFMAVTGHEQGATCLAG